MFEIHYRVPTAEGSYSEKVLKCCEYEEVEKTVEACGVLGYEVVENPICKGCVHKGVDCHGSINHVWTGCVSREVRV